MLAGLSQEEKQKYKLGNAENYKCVISGNCTKIEGVDDTNDFNELVVCLIIIVVYIKFLLKYLFTESDAHVRYF